MFKLKSIIAALVATLLLLLLSNSGGSIRAADVAGAGANADSDIYSLEISPDGVEFKDYATLNVRLLKQSQNAAHANVYSDQAAAAESSATESQRIQLSYYTLVESNPFDRETKEKLKSQLLRSSESSSPLLYFRLCRKLPAGRSSSSSSCLSSSFTYLRNILASNLNVNLTLNTGLNNRLNSLTIRTQPTTTTADGNNLEKLIGQMEHLNLYVSIQNIKTAQIPDTEVYLEKVKKEIEQKEKGAQADNQSFLSKYWVYIVPVVVIMFLMQLVNPEAAGGAPGGGGR
jgi:hypothetical protein